MTIAITTDQIKALRDKTGVSVSQCRDALVAAEGNMDKALENLLAKSGEIAAKKADRTLGSGVVVAYVHGSSIGVMVKLLCETDFVARNPEFKALAEDLALHISAMQPLYVSDKQLPEGVDAATVSDQILLSQPFVKGPEQTVAQVVTSAIQKFGEKIEIGGFTVLTLA